MTEEQRDESVPTQSGQRLSPPIDRPLGAATTRRLRLRRFIPDDLGPLTEICAKEEFWYYPFGRGFSKEETERFLIGQIDHWDTYGFGCWLVQELDGEHVVGYAGLSVPTFLPEILPAVEVGWRLDPAFWGRGYATEAATAALDEAFTTLGLDEVCSIPQTDNRRSVHVAERLGLRLVRPVAIAGDERRGPVQGLLYATSRDEWQARSSVTTR